jgi:hypothetical protein
MQFSCTHSLSLSSGCHDSNTEETLSTAHTVFQTNRMACILACALLATSYTHGIASLSSCTAQRVASRSESRRLYGGTHSPLLHCVRIGSGAKPDSYPVGTARGGEKGLLYPQQNSGRDVKLPGLRICEVLLLLTRVFTVWCSVTKTNSMELAGSMERPPDV